MTTCKCSREERYHGKRKGGEGGGGGAGLKVNFMYESLMWDMLFFVSVFLVRF